MIVSSTYFLERAFSYLVKNIWLWIGIVALALLSVVVENFFLFPFYVVYGFESLIWALWCIGVARVVATGSPHYFREWSLGALNGLHALWFLGATAFFSGLLAYAAFGITSHFPIQLSFLVLIAALVLEFFWWGISLLIQPRIALGITSIAEQGPFLRGLPARSTELLCKFLIVGFFAACISTLLLIQAVASLEAFIGLSAPSMVWIVFFQRTVVALWYALYTIAGVFLYRHIVAK